MQYRPGFRTLIACCLVFNMSAYGAAAPVPTAIVETVHGRVQGILDEGISAYKGIRYGAPPVAGHRFLPPRQPADWNHVADATDYGASAIQMYDRFGESDLSRQLATVFTTQAEMKSDNEDSLFLNVWTPAPDDSKRPVMVWFHGGGYSYGSGSWPVYDGANLARKGDVVVVTVNHRLNVFGYLHLAGIGGDRYAHSGNAGMLDLVQSLEWVRDNIAGFGGDPDNVTIMGESGGGSKVSTLLAMPRANGLFHKAIIQSGPGLTGVPADKATENARAILNRLDIDESNLEALQHLPADRIMDAVSAASEAAGGGFQGLRLAPVVDGDVLPRHPFTPDAPDQSADIPLLIGWNKDEMTIFNTTSPWFGSLTDQQLSQRTQGMFGDLAGELLSAYRDQYPDYSPTYLFNMMMGDSRMFAGSVTLAERKVAQQGAPVYMYYLVWETPVGDGIFKSPHTLDIPFMFNNVDKAVALTGESTAARELEMQMSASWLSFARRGNPNNSTVPLWPRYDTENRATMLFDVDPRVEKDPKGTIRTLLGRSQNR